MTDIFISYSRKDKAFVQRLFTLLEQQGQDAWVDWDDIEYAEDWWHKIQRGIAEADNFVFIMSPHSVRSKICFDEIQYAVETNKRIIPVVIANVEDSADQERTHPALKQHNWLFFRPEDSFETTFKTLLETVQRDPAYVRLHTRLLVNAQEWQANDQNKSLLLRGDNLRQAETWLQTAQHKEPAATTLHTEYITSSQRAERQGRQRTLGAGIGAVGIVVVLLFIALSLFQAGQRDELERTSITQSAAALDSLERGDILAALSQIIAANQIDNPPTESVAALREIAGSPGPVAVFQHDAGVTSAVLSPDQAYIIAGYADGSLRVWDAAVSVGAYSTPLFASPESEQHVESVNALDIDRQGRYVVSVGCGGRDPEITDGDTCIAPEVFLWELVDLALLLRNKLNPAESNLRSEMTSNPTDVDIKPFVSGSSIVEVGVAFSGAVGPIEFRYALDEAGNVAQPWAGYSQAGHKHNGEMLTAITYNDDDDILSGDRRGTVRYVQGLNNNGQGLVGVRDVPVQAVAASPTAPSGRSSRPYLIGFANGQIIVQSRNEVLNNLDLKSPHQRTGLSYEWPDCGGCTRKRPTGAARYGE